MYPPIDRFSNFKDPQLPDSVEFFSEKKKCCEHTEHKYRDSIIAMAEHDSPLQLAQKFWKAMCLTDGMEEVKHMLSPDCFMKGGFGSGARGVHEMEAICAKLTEINGKICGGVATFQKDIPFRVMRNKKQVRFLTTAKVGWISVSIGFALEFESEFIVKLVVMKNPAKGVFETDDTNEAPPSPAKLREEKGEAMVVGEGTTDTVKEVSGEGQEDNEEVENSEGDDDDDDDNIGGGDVGDDEEYADHSYYFGKFLGRAPPGSESPEEDESEEDEEEGAVPIMLADTLRPPFLTSKPPQIPPTVVVTVVGCSNLHSPLRRVFERTVNAYVSVQMKHMPVVQSTPVATSPGPDPIFPTANKFVFEAPPYGGAVMFSVLDKTSVGEDLLIAEVHVPLAAIATTSPSHSSATALSLPLHMYKQVSRFTRQKHKPHVTSGAASDQSESEGELGHLNVLISKIDIMKWWALEEIKARDAALDLRDAEEDAKRATTTEGANALTASAISNILTSESSVSEDFCPVTCMDSTDTKWEHDSATNACRMYHTLLNSIFPRLITDHMSCSFVQMQGGFYFFLTPSSLPSVRPTGVWKLLA